MLRRVLTAGAAALALAWSAGADAQQKTRITVYTALESDQLAPYKQAFEADNPDIDIQWVRESTGTITARFLAEKDNPRADAVWGLAVTSIILFDQAGLVQPYTPKGAEALKPQFRSTASPMAWTGMDAWLAVICYNTVEGKKRNIPKPESWADLTKPVYKGQITMPNPASSGTGFLSVSGWLQSMGEKGGWTYMDKLHENIAQYTHSGSKPCRQSGAGEFVVGISFDFRGNDVKAKGAPVELVFPKEGLGWDIEASGIVKTSKKMDAAKKLMDWVATKEANEAYAKNFAIVAHPDVKPALPHLPADLEKKLIKNNFAYAAQNREKILAEWQKRYDTKSEPKK